MNVLRAAPWEALKRGKSLQVEGLFRWYIGRVLDWKVRELGLCWLNRVEEATIHLCIGERNGNPLQFSCLENPRHGGAW